MKLIVSAVLIATAGQASALSCLFGDGAMAYEQALSNGSDARPVVGQLSWGSGIGAPVMAFEGQKFELPARFIGEVMQPDGTRVPFDSDIIVYTSCINGDCGYAGEGYQMLSFLHMIDGSPVMHAYPCQSYPVHGNDVDIALVQACLDGGPCTGAERQ